MTRATTMPATATTYFRNDMRSGKILVMIGIMIIAIGTVLTTLISFIGLIIMGVGIYQYSVAKRRYQSVVAVLEQEQGQGQGQ